jgi:hypothetical protein
MVKDFYSQFLGTPKKVKAPKIRTSIRGILPRKREIARVTNIFNKPIREPVSVKIKKEVLLRAKNKCQYPRCSIKEGRDIRLQIHHKNMVNDDNKLSNLMALCAIHHQVIHKKYKVVHNKDLMGRRISSKVVKKETKNKIMLERKNRMPWEFY